MMRKKGLTLIELLLVIGIVALLMAIVIVAIGPQQMLIKAKDAERNDIKREIHRAMVQYQIDEGDFPDASTIPEGQENALPICVNGIGGNNNCIDISGLTSGYIANVPKDAAEPNILYSGYQAYKEDDFLVVKSSHLGEAAADYPALLSSDLVGYWNFGQGSGASLLFDFGTRYKHGTLMNMDTDTVWSSDGPSLAIGNSGSLVFDGTSGYVLIENSTDLHSLFENNYSMSAWFKQTEYDPGFIVSAGAPNVGIFVSATGRIQLEHFTLSGYRGTQGGTGLNEAQPLNTWHLAVGVVNREEGYTRMYVDGVLQRERTWAAGEVFNPPASSWVIGGEDSNPSQFFKGNIADVRFYDVALTETEIARMAAGEG